MATRTRPVTKGKKKNTSRSTTKAKKTSRPKSRAPQRPTPELDGWITHTDLASNNPPATRAWTEKVLGWKFSAPMKTPNGDMFFFTYSDKGGGAIRANNPPEIPGSIPYIQVADCQAAYDRALSEGAVEMLSPTRVMDTVTVAIVRAPGGVPIGLSGP
jgi:uncharacterized protein